MKISKSQQATHELFLPHRHTSADFIATKRAGLENSEYGRSAINAINLSKSILRGARDAYYEYPDFESPNCLEAIDSIEFLLGIYDNNLDFILNWPSVAEGFKELTECLEGDEAISEKVFKLHSEIRESINALHNGVYIPGTNIFMISDDHRQVSTEDFDFYTHVARRINDTSFGATFSNHTQYLNVTALEDYRGVASVCGWVDIDEYQDFFHSDDPAITDQHTLAHESAHHATMYGLEDLQHTSDGSLDESPIYFCTGSRTVDFLDEVNATSTELESVKETTRRTRLRTEDFHGGLIRSQILMAEVMKPERWDNLTESGKLFAQRLIEQNRRHTLWFCRNLKLAT